VVTSEQTRFLLRARNALVDQTFTFRSFRARAVESPGARQLSFHAEIDTASLDGGAAGMASFVKAQLLEADAFPDATFDGTVSRVEGSDGCDVVGTLRLHGVTRELRFGAKLDEEPRALHLFAIFDLPRRPFGIGLRGVLDALVPDDVRVTLDVRAHGEGTPP
jgi:polyisoprenoid-binding protein YceI